MKLQDAINIINIDNKEKENSLEEAHKLLSKLNEEVKQNF